MYFYQVLYVWYLDDHLIIPFYTEVLEIPVNTNGTAAGLVVGKS